MTVEERKARIGKLGEWFRQQMNDPRGIISQQIANGILDDHGGVMSPIIHRNYEEYYQGMLVSEAKMRWMVSPSTARSYAEMAYRGVEPLLLKRALASGKATYGGLYLGDAFRTGSPPAGVLNLRRALELFAELGGPRKEHVAREQFLRMLVNHGASPENAAKLVRTMFREGMIYESKPGFFRRMG